LELENLSLTGFGVNKGLKPYIIRVALIAPPLRAGLLVRYNYPKGFSPLISEKFCILHAKIKYIVSRIFKNLPVFLWIVWLALPTQAQITALPEDSAMLVYSVCFFGDVDHVHTLIVKIKGDTVLNGTKYSKVYYAYGYDTTYSSNKETLHCFIRNDTVLKAYVRYPLSFNNDTSDILLYDFSQVVGDTFNFPSFHPIVPGYYCDTTFKYSVEFSDTSSAEYYPGTPSIYIIYSPVDNLCSDFMTFAEFTGSWDFIFYNELWFCGDCYSGFDYDSLSASVMRCFWYCGKWNYTPCIIFESDIPEYYSTSAEITVSPNPLSSCSIIKFNANSYTLFEIHDLQGRIVFSKKIDCKEDQIEIYRNRFLPGFYVGEMYNKNGSFKSLKILVE
jgi:hypothetical protein